MKVRVKEVNPLKQGLKQNIEKNNNFYRVVFFIFRKNKLNDLLNRLFEYCIIDLSEKIGVIKMAKRSMNFDEIRKAKKLARFLGEFSENFLVVVRLVEAVIKGEYQIETWNLVKLIGAIMYVILPLDSVLDAIAVVAEILKSMADIINEFKKWEENN